MPVSKTRAPAAPVPIAPRCTRKHPRLTKNRHVDEHMTFCALHAKAASNAKSSPKERANHREAARLHMAQALQHYRTLN